MDAVASCGGTSADLGVRARTPCCRGPLFPLHPGLNSSMQGRHLHASRTPPIIPQPPNRHHITNAGLANRQPRLPEPCGA